MIMKDDFPMVKKKKKFDEMIFVYLFVCIASSKFQAFEIDHIEKMLAFSLNFAELLQRNTEQVRLAQNEFNSKLKSMTGTDLLDAFVEQKKTGSDRPGKSSFIKMFVIYFRCSSDSSIRRC